MINSCEITIYRVNLSQVHKPVGESWKAVISDFMECHKPANLQVSINDNAASPAVVSLRLDQGIEALN